MKREIKFKAKRLDNGEWVKGSFVVMKIPALSKTTIGIVAEGGATLHEVDPSTVCQFTGLKDCEGKEVWEGDVIKSPYFGKLAIVKWDDSLCGFKCVGDTGIIFYSLSAIVVSSRWFVVGNKFEKEK